MAPRLYLAGRNRNPASKNGVAVAFTRPSAWPLAYPEPGKRGRGNKFPGTGNFRDVTSQRLSDARSLLDQPDLAETATNDGLNLSEARKVKRAPRVGHMLLDRPQKTGLR
jgi:hypothetical protein